MKSRDTFKEPAKKKQNQHRFMFFSELAAIQFGYCIASVPDGRGGNRKEVKYTATSSDSKAPEYKWPDKKAVWKGKASDMKFIGERKPWQKHHIPAMSARGIPPAPAKPLQPPPASPEQFQSAPEYVPI